MLKCDNKKTTGLFADVSVSTNIMFKIENFIT